LLLLQVMPLALARTQRGLASSRADPHLLQRSADPCCARCCSMVLGGVEPLQLPQSLSSA